jgi:hypothetical protein
MTTHVRFITATASLFVLLASFAVRADTLGFRGRIPFSFTAGTTAFAPGMYTVQSGVAQGVFLLRNQKQGVFLVTQGSGSTGLQDGRSRLVFRRYGNRYFLREVWFPGSSGRVLPETKDERTAASVATKTAAVQLTVTIDGLVD